MSRHPSRPSSAPLPTAERVFNALERFLHVEAASGIVLLIAASVAFAWANSPWAASYETLWQAPLSFGLGERAISQPLHFWINDGLMTIFFLVVGLEIRREIYEGALASIRLAALPLAAALGGIAAPALIFVALTSDPAARYGWAVPTATDIAFALGVLALLGKRIPSGVRVLLLALAIIDDIAAILVIALFYSGGIEAGGLLVAVGGVLGVLVFQRVGIRSAWLYIPPGLAVWFGLLGAGIHPTIAGVVLGLLTPVVTPAGQEAPHAIATRALNDFGHGIDGSTRDAHTLMRPVRELQRAQQQMLPPAVRVQAALHPWVAYAIMPLFALANAGVEVGGLDLGDPVARSIGLGVAFGLLAGKPSGIVLASMLAVRLRLCELPAGVDWRGLLLVGCLGGIGFTMAIFIANLAFPQPSLLAAAKVSVLLASCAAAVIGLAAGALLYGSRSRSIARQQQSKVHAPRR